MRSQRSRLMSLPEAAMNRSAPTTQTALRLAETAAWGARPRPRIRLVFWKPIFKGGSSLRGFVTIELPFGLKLIDCSIFVGPNGPWAALPSKPVLDCEGRQARASGKPQFAPVVEWRNRDLAERFSAAVIALVEGAHPAVLSERVP
jgi:hypothetical protein